MKIYARQVNPEYQESPLFMGDGFFPDNVAVFGNRDFVERLPDVVRRVRDVLNAGELSEVLENAAELKQWYRNVTEAIMDYLPPEAGRKYSTRDIHALKIAVKDFAETRRRIDEENALCAALSAVTGRKWAHHQISGCVQCEWNEVFYPSDDWSREALNAFEAEYFNNGSEWIVQDDGEKPESPDSVDGFSLYCVSWDDEEIRKEIASAAGCDPCDVTMYKWAGERRTAVYEEV